MTNSTVPAPVAFENIRNAIDLACERENYLVAVDSAKQHGLQGGDVSDKSFTLQHEYVRTDPDGHTLTLRYRMYDQTKTFGPIQKDMNKLELDLTLNGAKVRSYSSNYED